MTSPMEQIDDVGDVESWDLTKCKDEIKELQNDRERRQEATERLQEKLKALNNELAARRLEGEQKQLELKEQQRRNREKAEQLREQGDTGGELALREEDNSKVCNVLEEMVSEKAAGPNKKDKAKTQYGFRVFDETELMVEKPVEEDATGQLAPVDTVLIIHQKPNSDDVRYYLSYRVAPETQSKKLREDACNFWNLSEVEYVLLTVDNSKVHDELTLQHCFHPFEKCQLILAPKDPTRTALMPQELAATKPFGLKGKAKAQQKSNQDDASKRATTAQSFYDWMQSKPGIWNYMIQRDRNKVDHLQRIPFSSILIYASMLLLSVSIIYILVPPGRMYYTRNGPLTALTSEFTYVGSSTAVQVPKFTDIKTQAEAWDWLTYVVPHHLLNQTSGFRQHNYLTGWLRLRMQQVQKSASSACETDDVAPSGTKCVSYSYTEDTAGSESLVLLRAYWDGYNISNTTNSTNATGSSRRLYSDATEDDMRSTLAAADPDMLDALDEFSDRQRQLSYADWTEQYRFSYGWNLSGLSEQPVVSGVDGRSSTVKPWQFVEAADNALQHNVEVIVGVQQKYDPSGYNLDYDLQYNDFTALYNAYQADMVAINERGWFTNRTRSIFTQFTLYNGNYDLWANCEFIFEMSANSVVQPYLHINVFSASVKGIQHSHWLFWFDTVRLIFAVYAGTIQVCYEFRMCKEREESKYWGYLFTPLGMCDIGICFFALIIWLVRDLMLGILTSSVDFLKDVMHDENFMSSASRAWVYRFGVQCEGPLFGFLILRTLSFLRVNRHIYIIWSTMWECGKRHLPYLLVFIPVMFGFTVWGHTLYFSLQLNYTDLPSSFISIIMMALGDIDKDQMFLMHRPNTFIFAICFYIALVILLINTWVAVIVWTYEKIRVEAGYCPADYKWKEKHYANWMLFNPVARFYFNKLRPRIDKPRKFAHDDEED